MKLRQKFLMMLGQVTNHPSVCQELGEKALGQNQVQVVSPVGLLGHLELTVEPGGLAFHARSSDRHCRQVPGPRGSVGLLFYDELQQGRFAARNGVLVQREQTERSYLESEGALRSGRGPGNFRSRMPVRSKNRNGRETNELGGVG